jgi:hypothetical protein
MLTARIDQKSSAKPGTTANHDWIRNCTTSKITH